MSIEEATASTSNRAQRIAVAHQYLPVSIPASTASNSSGPVARSNTEKDSASSSSSALTKPHDPLSSEADSSAGPPDLHHVPFGSRLLSNPEDVYSHNAWDHVVPPPEWEDDVRARLVVQRSGMVEDAKRDAYNARPALYWDKFYRLNTNRFFKDRNWLRLEFGELMRCAEAGAGPKKVVEIGCGAGNTVFPLLASNENPELEVWACDYSWKAVEVVKENALYPVPPHGKGRLHASVWDVTKPPVPLQNLRPDADSASQSETDPSSGASSSLPEGVEPESIDIAIMIFVMSALHPDEWTRAVANVWKMLKPGGMLFLRDYGRYDLAQLRIKKGRMLGENLYVRGDGTRVYFFEASELSELLTGSKDAYTPAATTETTVEIDDPSMLSAAEGAGLADPSGESPKAPETSAGGDMPSLSDQLDSTRITDQGKPRPATEAEEDSLVEERSGIRYKKGQPFSTRFATPAQTVPTPRVDFQLHKTPVVDGAAPDDSQDLRCSEGHSAHGFNPFATPHSELGVPDHPLFEIDQLGVDRRMLVNRKEQLKMYRIWMQVKARKMVASS